MGELGEELGRVLKVLFLNLWKHLDPNTQHWLEVLAITVGAVGFAVAVAKDLAKIRKSSVVGAIDAIGRWFRSCVRRISLVFLPAIGLLLLAALGSWPYNFYILTRIVVCLTSVWLAVQLHAKRRFLWETLIIGVALIFNPVAPFHLDKDTWRILNILGAMALAPAFFIPITKRMTASFGEAQSPQGAQNYCTHCGSRLEASDCFCRRCGIALVHR